MALSKAEVHAIQEKALALLVESKADSLPINLPRVANHLGIKIAYDSFDEATSGVLVLKDGRAIIGVNKSHHQNRQRFTIAHEIGHFVLHHKSLNGLEDEIHVSRKWAYFRSAIEGSDDSQETQANLFAAQLLMPEPLLRETIRHNQLNLSDDADTSKLARFIQVSEQALAIRLVYLKLANPY